MKKLVHHHFIYQADVNPQQLTENPKKKLIQFLYDVVELIDMKVLIKPQVVLSENNAWTGLVGIVTSHISFHYWVTEQHLQFDVYSCKPFEILELNTFLSNFWSATKIKGIAIDREEGKNFCLKKIEL